MPRKPLYFEIFATALGALLLEISYTRIFSFKVFYYFTYLILGVGLLGTGAGGIAVATSERLRRWPIERLVPITCFLAGASVLAGYLIIAPIQLNIAQAVTSPAEIGKLALVSVLLTTTFVLVGIVLSTILGANASAANRLYGVDLIGAALGCIVAVPLVWVLTPPRTVMLAGLILAVGGLRLARAWKPLFAAGALVVLALALPLVWGSLLRDPVVAQHKRFEEFRVAGNVEYSKWSPVFRVDVADHPLHPGEVFLLFHDGQPGSGLRRFDGKTFKNFEHLDRDDRALPFAILPPNPRVLVIGAAGAHEIVASLYFKAAHVTGVELNPATYDVVTKVYADIAGNLADNPKVTLVNGDGRWFLKQTSETYDLIWFVAPDSYAAMNAATSGAFVLSESYLYTVEMVKECLNHLSPNGIIATQFGEIAFESKPNRTVRYLSTARAAFGEFGLRNFQRHALVSSAPTFPPFTQLSVLLGRSAFTAEQIDKFVSTAAVLDGAKPVYTPKKAADASQVQSAIRLPEPELPAWFRAQPYQLDPVRDDSPFFWHFARFRDVFRGPAEHGIIFDPEDTIAEQMSLVFLVLASVLSALLLLLPLVSIRSAFREMPHKGSAALYFASLGLGFMFLEIALIQKLTLLLGYPTYSLSVTLAALLVFSGIGSLASSRWATQRRRSLAIVLGLLTTWVLAAHAALPALIDRFVGSADPVRIAVAVLIVGPVGLCLGGFMPLGLRTVAGVSARAREYVAWAWAVNGFFSVIASILATILGMVIGFRWLLLVALAIYFVGAWALLRLPEMVEERAP
jgi:MFS family permease